MKKLTVLSIVITAFIFACNRNSTKEVTEAKENLTEAKTELQDSKINEKEAAKAKETAEWKSFQNESDSTINSAENDLKKMEVKVEKASKKDKQKMKMKYEKAKSDLSILREKLQKRNIEFENDIKSFDEKVSQKNQSFKREFKHDMGELGNSIKDLFKDNVK
jgi:ATPase subunit of ABC transporter with duplicated ATPase domains